MKLKKIYDRLLEEYGFQGWWPLLSYDGTNPTKTGSVKGYHPGDYSFPRDENQKFEIICGALLTQNTSWRNVERALINMKNKGILSPEGILKCDFSILCEATRPAGYFNQKSKRLKIIADFFVGLGGRLPSKDELLGLNGVGPETADSILLYAYQFPSFVVDAYTRRIFSNLGLIKKDASYDEIKSFFEENLERDFKVYQEFHALIVEHAKRFYLTKKEDEDFLLRLG